MIKTDAQGFVVDPESQAILNVDELAWLKYKAERDQALKLQNLEEQVAILNNEVMRLKKIIEEKLS